MSMHGQSASKHLIKYQDSQVKSPDYDLRESGSTEQSTFEDIRLGSC